MIVDLLERSGICSEIAGEYLQGDIGERSSVGNLRVLVAEESLSLASRVITDWESVQAPGTSWTPSESDTPF